MDTFSLNYKTKKLHFPIKIGGKNLRFPMKQDEMKTENEGQTRQLIFLPSLSNSLYD